MSARAAHAEPRVVNEADVLAAALARDPEVIAARAAVAASKAREAGEGVYPNPSLSWSREHIPGSGPLAVHEDSFALSLPIELGGARSARSALAETDTAEARTDAALTRAAVAQRALAWFYEALAAREHSAIARDHVARLAEAERVLARRVAEGSASGYELGRLQLEAELSRSALSDSEASVTAKTLEIAWWLGVAGEPIELSGDLEPQPASTTPTAPRALDEARAAQDAAARAQDAASSAWFPPLEAHLGPKLVGSGGDDAVGYVAGLSVELPLFDRKQGLSGHAAARSAQLRARHEAIARDAERRRARAERELERASAEIARFDRATAAQVDELERAAQAAYREGRQSILELLDAQRMRTQIEERKLALRLTAKQAELGLRAARGELEGDGR